MAAKRRRKRIGSTPLASSSPQTGGGLSQQNFIAILIVVFVAVTAVSALVLFNQRETSPSAAELGALSLDKSKGDEGASVVVVEYADFQCPFCRQFAEGAEQQLQADHIDTGQVRFVFRNLAFIGDESLWAAEAAECANAQGRFWEYHDKLYAEQAGENEGAFRKDNLKRFAAELGLDTVAFNPCLDTEEYRGKVQAESREAQRLGVNSTPTVFVNGQRVEGGSDYRVLNAAIETALTQAGP
jgi:protein-disulfide isomerase